MDAPQRDKLKALALAADQGKWEWEGRREDEDGYVYIPECSYLVGNICLAGNYENDAADCDYIAAANPATVLDLLADRDAMQMERDDLRAEVERLRAELAAGAARQGGGTNSNSPEFDGISGSAPAAGTVKDAERLLIAIVRSDIGISTRHKLEDGQGTKTEAGTAWLEAIDFVAAITARAKAGKENA